MKYNIRKANINDSSKIQQIINQFADQKLMLHRSLQYVYENIRNFHIATDESDKIVGVCSVGVSNQDLAEVKSLAVLDEFQKNGIAKNLVLECIKESSSLGISKVFCLTYSTDFFAKLGFTKIEKDNLPHKIWTDCINCPSFPNCDEVAMIKERLTVDG